MSNKYLLLSPSRPLRYPHALTSLSYLLQLLLSRTIHAPVSPVHLPRVPPFFLVFLFCESDEYLL